MSSRSLKIAFFGSSLVSSYWNGACTYYRGIIRNLYERGHRITFYEPDAFERQQHRDIADPDWAEVVVYGAEKEAQVLETIELARGADVIVKTSGVGVFDPLLEEAVLALSAPHTVKIFWDVDAPATLARVEGDAADPFRSLLPDYDLILTFGGGEPVAARYAALGAVRCINVYNALDPRTHFPVDPRQELCADLTLLANRLPDREERVKGFFLDPARELSQRRFLLGGSGWDADELPSNVVCLGHVSPQDHNALNCSPLAVLNVTRSSMAANGFSPATRVFEAAGAGACLITDAWRGIEQFLEPDREILVAETGEDVVLLLSELDENRRRSIGRAARQRILAEHTYAHRAAQVEEILT
jgi:spore maturation protein CgeB